MYPWHLLRMSPNAGHRFQSSELGFVGNELEILTGRVTAHAMTKRRLPRAPEPSV